MKYKKYLRVFSVSIFAISALMIGSVHSVDASFWDWFGLGGNSQQAQVNTTTYKWVNNGLVSESSGRNTGTCAKVQTTTYTCGSSNVGARLYDGTNRGASYGDVGHAWPIYEGVNTSVATEYTYSGCGLDKRTGGQVNQWECKAVNTTTNSSVSSVIPTVQTIQPSNITTTSATLKGIVDPKDKTSKTYFEIFPDPNGGSYGMMTPQQTAVNYYGVQEFSFNLTNLKPGTTYTYYAYVSYYDSTTGTNKVIKDTVGKTVTTSFESNSNPIISVTSPNGGEIFKQGDVMTVSWKSTGIIPVDAWVGRIALYNNNGASFLIDLVPFLSKWPTSGSIQWLIPNNSVIGSDFKVQTILYKGVVGNESVISSDFSNASFTIASGSSSSSSSTAIPTVQTGYPTNITTNSATLNGMVDPKDKTSKVSFEVFPDPNGGSYGMLTTSQSVSNSSGYQSFSANISNLKMGMTYTYYARVTYYDPLTGTNKTIKDNVGKTVTTAMGSSSSSSAQPSITVISPNGGEKLIIGKSYPISWTTSNWPQNVPIAISLRPMFGGSKAILLTPNDGIENWTVPSEGIIPGNNFYIEMTCPTEIGNYDCPQAQGNVYNLYDSSDTPFSIVHEGSSSSSSTSAGVSVTTGVAEYSSTNANLSGSVSNPNKENVSYYFNYRKETESSAETKQTPWTSVNSASFTNISAPISGLTPETKYVYRLYAYSYTTGQTVSGDLKSFTTRSSSSSSSSGSKPFVRIISPNGGELYRAGDTVNIQWDTNAIGTQQDMNIALVTTDLSKWSSSCIVQGVVPGLIPFSLITSKTAYVQNSCSNLSYPIKNTGNYPWSIPRNIVPDLYYIVVNELKNMGESDNSNGPFTISSSLDTRYIFTRELGYGSSGNDVTELQKRLTSKGYYSGPITGYYGSMTMEAVKKYQMSNELTATGYVGPQTLAVLNGSTVNSTSVSSSSQGTSLSQLVELFIALGIISPDKADVARASVKGM